MVRVKCAAVARRPLRFELPALLIVAICCVPFTRAQQTMRQSPENDIAIAQMHKLAGKLLAQGRNSQPAGELGLRSYLVEEVTLARPLQVEIAGLKSEVSRGWRLTITGGPFVVRAMPAMIWIDNVLLGYGVESVDLQKITVITFDRSLLRDGAAIALSYGESDPARTELPERLALPTTR